MHVSQPQKRDNVSRPAVEVDMSMKVKKKTIKELEEENGGEGVFNIPLQ